MFLVALALTLPIVASAATFEVKALIDTDNSRGTGCTMITPGGLVSGIDVVLTTAGTVTGTTGTVTGVTRQTCSGGSLGLPTAVDSGGWNVGVSPSGDLFIESHFGLDLITMDNIRSPRFVFTASSGTLSDVILTPYSWGGGDIVMLQAARDRAVASAPPRTITLDGNSSDWAGVVPLGNGTQTVPAWRFISASAYAGSHDLFFAYAIHTNPAAPTAIDDHYALGTLGGTLTVATLGVQNNDIANFQPITSVKTDNPQHGSVTLAGDGGFTYVHDGSLANQDQFHYVLNPTTLPSNIATVTIDLPGSRTYAFTSANNTTFVAGQFNSFQVVVTGKPTPALTEEGNLPAGVSFADNGNGTGTLSGTPGPNTSGTYDIVFHADKNKPHHISQSFTLTVVCPGITVTNPSVTTGTAGTAFSQTFTQSGGQLPVTFVLNSGTLPTGLSLSTSGVLSGTPTQSGTFPITVKVTDNAGCMAVGNTYNLVINCHTVTVTNPGTSTGTANVAFSQTFTQSGAVSGATFTINSGTLPAGLALNSSSGVLSGTPTQTGSFPITVRVTDGQGCVGVGPTYNLSIGCQTITVTNPATNNAAINVAFSQTFTAGNTIGAVTFTLNSGTLPSGLTLSAAGVLSGSPTQTGSFPITVKATDANGCFAVGGTYTLTVWAPPVANADSYIVTSVPAPGVLGNDTTNGAPIVSYGINGTEQTTIGSSTPTSQGGTVVLNADGSLTYTPAGGFTGTDTFKYKLTNFAGSSTATVSMQVNVAPVNTVPGAQSTNEDTPLVFSTGNSNAISISDADAGTSNVQVALTVTNGIVTLSGTSGLSITGGANGTNTVTVQGTIANINAALNGMSFTPSLNYNGAASLQIVTNDLGNTGSGGAKSDTDSVAITVNAVNDPPVLTAGGTLSYTENGAAAVVDATVTVSDVDNANLASATVQITGNYQNGADVLSFVNTVNITGVFNAGTGTLTLTGSDTLANYQTALRNVKYANTSDNPSTAARTVTWIGNDGTSGSTPVTSTINVTAVNDAPVVTAGGTLSYTENQAATAIDGAITVTDPDSANLISATAQITSNYVNGEDILSFVNTGTISGSFDSLTGKLTLTGSDTVANYQTALRNVLYNNTSENPSASARTVTWQVNDGAGANNLSNTPTSTINVTPVNDAPVVTAGHTSGYTENGAPITLEPALTITDPDSTNGQSALVTVSGNADLGNDVLACPACAGLGITAVFTSGSGNLALTGATTLANYQTALRSVTFSSTSENPRAAQRFIDWFVTDSGGAQNADTTANDSYINITRVNDAPVNTVPVAQSTNEDTAKVFSSGNSNAISVADVDSSGLAEQVQLNATNGTVTLSTLTNLTVTAGANGSATVTVQGLIADLNAALNGLSFLPSPDFNGSASLQIVTNDLGNTGTPGPLSDTDSVAITVNAVNDPPVVTAGGTLSYTENQAATAIDTGLTITDVDSANLTGATVTISGNFNSAQDVLAFTNIGSITFVSYTGGVLTITGTDTVGNYQAALRTVTYQNTSDNPTAANRTITWIVNDGTDPSVAKTSTVQVTAVNDAPVAVNDGPGGSYQVLSGATVTVVAPGVLSNDTDAELSALTVSSVTGTGAPQAVGGTSGTATTLHGSVTMFADGHFTYTHNNDAATSDSFTYTANDGALDSNNATVTITIIHNQRPVGVNDSYTVTEGLSNVTPNSTLVANSVLANDTDAENDPKTAVLVSGPLHAAASSFTLNSNGTFTYTHDGTDTGNDSFTYTPNDAIGAGNVTTVTINVTPVNDPPVITSANTANVPENTTAVLTVTSTDEESNTVTYSITGGADQLKFSIVSGSGALSFITPPNFEAPTDSGANNVYDVQVTANDGTNNTPQNIAVTVTNVDEAPVFTSSATPSVPENTTAVITVNATDPEAAAVTYAITGGADQLKFSINTSSGALTFNVAPNFEAPTDADANNIYLVQVTATDQTAHSGVQSLSVTVTNANDPPVITSANTASVFENSTAVLTVTSTDQDANTVTYSVTGGLDQSKFSIVSGALSFITPPNFEAPTDSNADNQYIVQVTANDGAGGTTNQTITVTVNNVDEAPVFSSTATPSVPENSTPVGTVTAADPEGTTVKYTLTGGADQLKFSLDTNTGALAFITPPNFESPTDAGTNNVYDVQVTAQDQNGTGLTSVQNIAVTVTNVNEAPSFTSTNTNSIPENTTAAKTVTASDPDTVPAFNTLTYSIVTVAGEDSAKFSIGSSSGALTFNVAPNFESPNDVGGTPGDNIYVVTVQVSDTTNTVQQTISITVTDVNEAPTANIDSYTALSNTTMLIGTLTPPGTTVAATGDVTTVIRTSGVIGNDTDPDGPASGFANLSVSSYTGNAGTVAAGVATTTTHGTITVSSDGSILYTPAPGNTLDDTFTYNLTDGTNTVGPTTVTIHIATPRIWYVRDNTTTAGTAGTSADPFKTVAALNATTFAANDIIYIMTGSLTGGTRLPVPAPITLNQNNMKIWGQGVALQLTVNTHVLNLISAGTAPNVGVTGAGTDSIDVTNATTTEVKGLNVQAGANAISVTSTATNSVGATIANTTISGATGIGIALTAGGSGASAIDVQGISITSTGNGFAATRTAGTMSIVFSTNTVSSGATGVSITGGAVASSTITGFLSNNISGNTVGTGINIQNVTFDGVGAGSPFTVVDFGNTLVGDSGNSVGGSGIILGTSGNPVQGFVNFSNGLSVYAAGGSGLAVTGTGAWNDTAATGTRVDANSGTRVISAVGGPAVSLDTLSGNVQITTITSSGSPSNGVNLTSFSNSTNPGTTSTFSAGSGSSITTATGNDFNITAGNANVTYDGTISDNSGRPVSIANATGGTKSFTGAITNNGGTGISLTSNGGTTMNFSGNLTLSTGSSTAFNATGGGTVTATNTASTIVTTTGTGVNINSTTIGGTGVKFLSINVSGAANGINLNTTGAGPFTVIGDGTASNNGSGGTIQNTTAEGIFTSSTGTISLSHMNVSNSGTKGISVTGSTGFTLDRSNVTDNAGVATHNGVHLINNTGTIAFTDDVVDSAPDNQVNIDNFNTNLTAINASNSTFKCTAGNICQPSGGTGADGFLVQIRGTSVLTSANVTGCTMTGNRSTGIQVSATDSATIGSSSGGAITAPAASHSFVIQSCTINNNNAGIDMDQTQHSNHAFELLNNTMSFHKSSSINAFGAAGVGFSGSITGYINGNQIGIQGTKDSGSTSNGAGVRMVVQGDSTQGYFTVDNNQIREVPNSDVIIAFSQNGATPNTGSTQPARRFKITNNTLPQPSGTNQSLGCGAGVPCGAADGVIWVYADENNTNCALVTGNNVYDATTMNGSWDILLSARTGPPAGATITIQTGANGNSAAAIAFLNLNNTLNGANKSHDESGTVTAVTSCGSFPP
jgi:VCBS repeat-containing protein